MRRAQGWTNDLFSLEAYRVSSYHREVPVAGGLLPDDDAGVADRATDLSTEATVKVWVGDERIAAVGEGNGPVNALDAALRAALSPRYPALGRIHLTDFKVRVLDGPGGAGEAATGAVVRVLIDSTDGDAVWTTIGVSPNIIEASWIALVDAILYGLLHTGAGSPG
jgi:2-isopropylmalate synthase